MLMKIVIGISILIILFVVINKENKRRFSSSENFVSNLIEINKFNNLVNEYKNEYFTDSKIKSLQKNFITSYEYILENKKVKKVDKIEIGKEKRNKEEIKDPFLIKVEKFVEKELEISNENIYVSYS